MLTVVLASGEHAVAYYSLLTRSCGKCDTFLPLDCFPGNLFLDDCMFGRRWRERLHR
jgi:hypothetical protein